MSAMHIFEDSPFKKSVKKLHSNQKQDLYEAIQKLMEDPNLGQSSDLIGIRVYKFRMANQLTLLAYSYENDCLNLYALGSHENFYRDLKKI